MYCEGHPLNLSTLTLHRPQTSSFFTHLCMYSIAIYRTFWKLLLLRLTARWQYKSGVNDAVWIH